MSVVAFDTETTNGYVRVLTCSNGQYIESGDTDSLLLFLYDNGRDATYNVFWNIDFDFSAIIKPFVVINHARLRAEHYKMVARHKRLTELSREQELTPLTGAVAQEYTELLDEEEEAKPDRYVTERFTVTYLQRKGFSVKPRKGRKKARWFFDAAQFYSTGFGGCRLEDAAQQYLGEGKSDGAEGVSREKMGTDPAYYTAHRDAIIRYSIRDCALTARLFEITIQSFADLGAPLPEHPFSKASISKALLESKGVMEGTCARYDKLAMSGDLPFFKRAYRGGMFLQKALGHFEGVVDWDINSAYPAAMVTFPSLEGAVPVPQSDPRFKDSFFKFYLISSTHGPLLPARKKDKEGSGLLYAPNPTPVLEYVTGPDLVVLDAYGHPYEVVDAVGVWCPSDERPLAFLNEIYERKASIKADPKLGPDHPNYNNIKVLLNGCYGLLAQRRPREGKYTNYVYASYVTALCRRQLLLKAHELECRGDTVLSYATDGLMVLPARAGASAPSSTELGAWSVEKLDGATLFASGVYVKTKGSKEVLKKRGMPSLTVQALRECPSYEMLLKRTTPFKLRQALIQDKTEDIAAFLERTVTLSPADALYRCGFSVGPEIGTLPLRQYFRRSYVLNWREKQ